MSSVARQLCELKVIQHAQVCSSCSPVFAAAWAQHGHRWKAKLVKYNLCWWCHVLLASPVCAGLTCLSYLCEENRNLSHQLHAKSFHRFVCVPGGIASSRCRPALLQMMSTFFHYRQESGFWVRWWYSLWLCPEGSLWLCVDRARLHAPPPFFRYYRSTKPHFYRLANKIGDSSSPW